MFTLAFGVMITFLSFFFSNSLSDDDLENLSHKIEKHLESINNEFDKGADFKEVGSVFHYTIIDQKLKTWNEHTSGILDKELLSVKSEKWQMYKFKSGIYAGLYKQNKVLLVPFYRKYRIESSHLFSHVNKDIFPVWVSKVQLRNKNNKLKEISFKYGKLYLALSDDVTAFSGRTILYVLGVFLIALSLVLLRKSSHKKVFYLAILFVFLTAIFLFFKILGIPEGLSNYPLFSSSAFAYSSFFSSLGDVLYLSLLALLGGWLLLRGIVYKDRAVVFRWLKKKSGTSWAIYLLLFCGYLLFMLLYAGILMLHQNTTLILDVTYELDFFTVKFFYYVIFAVFSAVFLLGHLFLTKLLFGFSFREILYKHIILALVFIPIIVLLFSWQGLLFLSAYALIALLMYKYAYYMDRMLGYELHGLMLLWILMTSGIVATVILDETIKRKERTLHKVSERLITQGDEETEYLMFQIKEQIESDISNVNFMRVPGMGLKRIVKERMNKLYLKHYFSEYNIDLMLFDHKGEELFQQKPLSWWKKRYLKPENRRLKGVYFSEDLLGEQNSQHFISGDFKKDGIIYGSFLIRLQAQELSSKGIVPELLRESKIEYEEFEKVHYCVIRNGEVKYSIGKIDYDKQFLLKHSKNNHKVFSDAKMLHEIELNEQNNGVIVSVEKNALKVWLDNFSFHLIILSTVFFGGLFIYIAYRMIKGNPIGVLSKVQLYLYISFLVPLILVSVVSLSITRSNYDKKIHQDFESKVKYLTEVVKSVVTKNPSLLKGELQKIAKYSQTDISIFDLSGQLRYTTQPLLYDNLIISKHMSSEAYRQVIEKKQKAVFLNDRINEFDYKSIYVSVQNNATASPLCVVHFPLFYSYTTLKKSKAVQFTTVLEIFIVVFFIIVLLAILSYWSILTPVLLVANRLKETSFTEKEKYIEWNNDDEIGTIVSGYNTMLDKIAEAKQLLKKTEKEKAWRQMAQQVAHEIKNPLTPMKLKLQMMQYRLAKKTDEDNEQFQKEIHAILEQVDIVSDIATSFSSFAKMPAPKEEVVDLLKVLNREVELFSHEGIEIKMLCELSTIMVSIDEKLLSRVISNILLNAQQSYDNDDLKLIEVSCEKTEENITFSIQDFGKGIADEIKNKVFLPNFTTKVKGSGIGLDVAKRGVEFCGGRIWFESELGEGTVFHVQLPLIS